MKKMQLREAKARFSALIEAAERGETTIVTKRGRETAVIAPIEAAHRPRAEAQDKPTLIEWLMKIPHDVPVRRSRSRMRKVDL